MAECPICRFPDSAVFHVKRDRSLLICSNCRHIWWRELPDEAQVSDYYRVRYTEDHSQDSIQGQAREYYRHHLKELASAIGRKPREITLMDYGCSIPVLPHEAVRMSFRRVWGVDWASQSKEWGQARGVEVIAPPELASVPDRSVDIVRFSHVLEHSIDPAGVLRKVMAKLRPGALVYITQPNVPVFRVAESQQDLPDSVYPEHLHFFSALSLVELATCAGLAIARFFAPQNETAAVSRYGELLDIDYAREKLAPYAAKGDPYFPAHANFPYYAGENSCLYARMERA